MGKPNMSAKVPGQDTKGFSMSKGAGVNSGSSSGKQMSQSYEKLTGPKPGKS